MSKGQIETRHWVGADDSNVREASWDFASLDVSTATSGGAAINLPKNRWLHLLAMVVVLVGRLTREPGERMLAVFPTGYNGTNDQVNELRPGADDQWTMPFRLEELTDSIHAVLHHNAGGVRFPWQLMSADQDVHAHRQRVCQLELRVQLSSAEFVPSQYRSLSSNRLLPARQLLDHLESCVYRLRTTSLMACILCLRRAVDTQQPRLIYTSSGTGHVLRET